MKKTKLYLYLSLFLINAQVTLATVSLQDIPLVFQNSHFHLHLNQTLSPEIEVKMKIDQVQHDDMNHTATIQFKAENGRYLSYRYTAIITDPFYFHLSKQWKSKDTFSVQAKRLEKFLLKTYAPVLFVMENITLTHIKSKIKYPLQLKKMELVFNSAVEPKIKIKKVKMNEIHATTPEMLEIILTDTNKDQWKAYIFHRRCSIKHFKGGFFSRKKTFLVKPNLQVSLWALHNQKSNYLLIEDNAKESVCATSWIGPQDNLWIIL